MTSLSLPAAELIAQTLGCIVYGIYLVTLGIAGRLLLTTESGKLKRRSEMNWIILVVSIVLFVNGTLNLVVATITVVQAFVVHTDPSGVELFFRHGSGWQTVVKSFNVPFQSLVGDGILIYRCWFLWNKSWTIIALPLLIWLANMACFIRLLYLITQASQGLIISSTIQPWGRAYWSMTICISITATSLIVGRIWMVERQNRKFRASGLDTVSTHQPRSTLSHAMRNIIESGMIYTVVSIFTLVTYTMQSTWHYPVSGLEMHSVGITFNLILIRRSHPSRSPQDGASAVSVPLQFTQTQADDGNPATVAGNRDGNFRFSHLNKYTTDFAHAEAP
ncbi:Carboxylic ester hydrolase [Mycena venus]|uniref:Carboxylic ester hydrolase n=1 Tax=Mycena venus TaxID=2733690 RepID=A0A8H7D8J0_9AGAR|nr:Carboxylic ester hydrolase [Mycena venus]